MLCVSLLIYFAFEGLLSETNQCICCFVILMDMAMVFGLYIIGAFEWKDGGKSGLGTYLQ